MPLAILIGSCWSSLYIALSGSLRLSLDLSGSGSLQLSPELFGSRCQRLLLEFNYRLTAPLTTDGSCQPSQVTLVLWVSAVAAVLGTWL